MMPATMPTIRNASIAKSSATRTSLLRALNFEHVCRERDAGDGQTLGEFRTDADGHEVAHDFAGRRYSALPIDKDVLHGDDVAFHAGDFSQVGDFTGAVAETRDLHDDVDCGGNLPAHRGVWKIQGGHGHHGLKAGQS